jgi:multiple sugar transport system substrate-binding protein
MVTQPQSDGKLSRRQLLRLSALTVSGAVLVACAPAGQAPVAQPGGESGQSAAPAEQSVDLTYANYSSGVDKELWDGIIATFHEQNPNINVTYVPIPGDSWGEYFDKIATLIAGGSAPDVVRVAIEGTKLFVAKDLAMPLDDFAEGDEEIAEFRDDVNEQLLNVFVIDGNTYQFPFDWNNMVMFYNTAMFEEAGLERPAEDWSVDEWLEIAQMLTKRTAGSNEPEVFGFGTAVQYFAGMMPWIFNFGGNLLSEDWTESQVNSPEVVEAITFMRDLIWEHEVAPQAPSSHNDILNLAASGRLAMWGGGRWPTLTLTRAGFYDFDVQYWPVQRTQITEFGVGGFPILKSTQHADQAWSWVKYLTTKEAFEVITKLGQSIPARRSMAQSESMFELPPTHANIYYESVDSRPARAVPSPAQYNVVEATMRRYLGQILANEIAPEEGLDSAHAEVSEILAG